MNFNIHAGMRVLYKKNNSNWLIGELEKGTAVLNEDGLYLPIWTEEAIKQMHSAPFAWEEVESLKININDIFFDAVKLEDWMKDNLVKKEDYVKIIQKEGFEKNLENAWFSDGEYYYYPVSKFSEGWIMRQPFNYVIRGD